MIFEVEWYTNRSADNSVDMKQATTSAPKVEFDFHQDRNLAEPCEVEASPIANSEHGDTVGK